jgi:hypothetical protein
MKINELLTGFTIFTSREEDAILERLNSMSYLHSFTEREQVIIEGLVRKSLVIKIGDTNPRVIANEFDTPS